MKFHSKYKKKHKKILGESFRYGLKEPQLCSLFCAYSLQFFHEKTTFRKLVYFYFSSYFWNILNIWDIATIFAECCPGGKSIFFFMFRLFFKISKVFCILKSYGSCSVLLIFLFHYAIQMNTQFLYKICYFEK